MSVLSVLDRVFVSNDWESRYNMANLFAPTRIGSDHTPLLLDTGDSKKHPPRQFHFEKQWCLEEDFITLVQDKWDRRAEKWPQQTYSLDKWHGGDLLSATISKSMGG